MTENNTKCYGATFQNNGHVRVQKLKDVHDDKNIIFEVNPMETFIGKSHLCRMTEFSGARDDEVFNGNTIVLEIGKENNKHKYVYIGGDMIASFLTNDRIYKYISNIGNNLSPCSIAIGWKNIYYLAPFFKFIKKENIDVNDIDKLFDIDYDDIMKHKDIKINKIHSNHDEEIEINNVHYNCDDKDQSDDKDNGDYKYKLPIFRLNSSE